MKKFIFVICLALTALPVIANGVGQVGTDCASGIQGSRKAVAEAPVSTEVESTTTPTTTTTVR